MELEEKVIALEAKFRQLMEVMQLLLNDIERLQGELAVAQALLSLEEGQNKELIKQLKYSMNKPPALKSVDGREISSYA